MPSGNPTDYGLTWRTVGAVGIDFDEGEETFADYLETLLRGDNDLERCGFTPQRLSAGRDGDTCTVSLSLSVYPNAAREPRKPKANVLDNAKRYDLPESQPRLSRDKQSGERITDTLTLKFPSVTLGDAMDAWEATHPDQAVVLVRPA
jgi:hypothetical protein